MLVVILVLLIIFTIGINKDLDKINENLSLLEENTKMEEGYSPIKNYESGWYYEDGNKYKDRLSVGYRSTVDGYSISGSRFIDGVKLLFIEEEDYLYKISESIYVLLNDKTGNNLYIIDENDVNIHHFVKKSFIDDNNENEDKQTSNEVHDNKSLSVGRYNLFDEENRITDCINIDHNEENNTLYIVFYSHRKGEKVLQNGVVASVKGVFDESLTYKEIYSGSIVEEVKVYNNKNQYYEILYEDDGSTVSFYSWHSGFETIPDFNNYINYQKEFDAEIILLENVYDYIIESNEGNEITIQMRGDDLFISEDETVLRYEKDVDWYSE
ncbi:MAG: hypothetical protein JEY96_19335 [Bacteroidales bacterium]|nr:hypothetical protein [Bacteroidales bacterium]